MNRKHQDRLEKHFAKHWYLMWQWWFLIIIVILCGFFLFNRYQNHENNVRSQKQVSKDVNHHSDLSSDEIASTLKKKRYNTKHRAINTVSLIFANQHQFSQTKVKIGNNYIVEVHIPKHASIYGEINQGNLTNWKSMVSRLKDKTKLLNQYHQKELNTPDYSHVIVVNPSNPKTMFLYVVNGQVKFNAIKKQ
ncbi:hypothetical protein WR164_05440 [Philodulcilactobacillus myokoensis]|uniref:Uncharacterized protein n=1 Tax=Philodulcilactobacillus myokoensis TaxID=2929573 RepID=A0A9W6ES94_9LACO|nr:hypothetical protein [Philodulcilactobacillus myokoensis]GLB46565.1 hypothetical protein WR164_05440 [Philodulcilactobacillus myokoensis]